MQPNQSKTSQEISEVLMGVLCCPHCYSELERVDGVYCSSCEVTYRFDSDGPLDIRLQKVKEQKYTAHVGTTLEFPSDSFFKPLQDAKESCLDVSAMKLPKHLDLELASYIECAKSNAAVALDLGCGKTPNKEIIEYAGYNYLGIDYRESEADLRADAHALPIKDNSIDFAISLAVLEHLQHPQIAVQEVCRVLKPGGRFIGSVAFLQPFHDYSYCHLSHIGMYNLLKTSDFEVEAVAPCSEYSVLVANSRQLFRQMKRKYSRMLIKPLEALHKLWWLYNPIVPGNKELTEIRRIQKFSGAQLFVARKKNR